MAIFHYNIFFPQILKVNHTGTATVVMKYKNSDLEYELNSFGMSSDKRVFEYQK